MDNKIQFRSFKETPKINGLNVDVMWIDEAEEIDKEADEVIRCGAETEIYKEWERNSMRPRHGDFVFLIIMLLAAFLFMTVKAANSQPLTASWYSEESCKREGTSGIMANGEKLDDTKLTAASWDYRFGTKLTIRNTRNGKTVRIRITDRGPSRRLYKQGRVIDLSKAAFLVLEKDLGKGVIPIEIIEN